MVLKLKQLFDVVGEKSSFEYEISLADLETYTSYPFNSPIAIIGSVINKTGVVTLSFSTKFTMKYNCDRCLCEFKQEFFFDFQHILVLSLNTDTDEFILCPDKTLDLNDLAITDLLLQLPTKILCKDDCKGLCIICGNDNNISECSCLSDEH